MGVGKYGRFVISGWKSDASVAQCGTFNQRLMREVAQVWSLLMADFGIHSSVRLKVREGTR